MPLSSSEVDYPRLRAIHAASGLDSPSAVARVAGSRSASAAAPAGNPDRTARTSPHGGTDPWRDHPASRLDPPVQSGTDQRRRTVNRALGDRPSLRGRRAVEAGRSLPRRQRGGRGDGGQPIATGPTNTRSSCSRPGDHRRQSAYLCLDQSLGGDAAAVLYFLAPLDALLRAFGNRGYRLANLEAGLMGGRAYLAAYAQRFGATGLTFYDDEVVRFFSPHAAGLDAIFVTALGRAAPAVRAEVRSLLHAR